MLETVYKPTKLRDSNPFKNGKVLVYPDGQSELYRKLVVWTGVENDQYYTVRIGDYLDKIAYEKYKDIVSLPDKYWWVIADANEIDNPLDISSYVGKEIVIPDIQVFSLLNSFS